MRLKTRPQSLAPDAARPRLPVTVKRVLARVERMTVAGALVPAPSLALGPAAKSFAGLQPRRQKPELDPEHPLMGPHPTD